MVIPSIVDIPPVPLQRIPQQRGTDYAYIKKLADEAGYVFYLEAGPGPGTSKAYWGPEIRVGEPQPALTTGMDAQTNVEQLCFNFDKEKKTMPIVFFQEGVTQGSDRHPDSGHHAAQPAARPRAAAAAEDRRSSHDTGHLTAPEALMAGLAYAGQHSDSVFGNGRLDVARYGRLLKSRQLVGVRGAGLPFDGLYYVKSVTHEIERGEYKQSFTLARNGLISTVPTVPT